MKNAVFLKTYVSSHTPDFVTIAGPRMSEASFRAATIPDGPGGRWDDGSVERIEASNREILREHFAKLAKDCLIQPHHPPINILGGNKEWRHSVTGGPIFTELPAIDLSPRETVAADGMRSDWKPTFIDHRSASLTKINQRRRQP